MLVVGDQHQPPESTLGTLRTGRTGLDFRRQPSAFDRKLGTVLRALRSGEFGSEFGSEQPLLRNAPRLAP